MHKLSVSNAKSVRNLIHAAAAASCEQRYLHRLHGVLLVATGRSCYEVSRWFGENPRTVERWVHAFDTLGVEGLREHHAYGRPARLAGEQVQRLAHDLQNPPRLAGYPEREWSGKRVAQHLERCYGIKLGARQCQRIMRRLAGGGAPRMA